MTIPHVELEEPEYHDNLPADEDQLPIEEAARMTVYTGGRMILVVPRDYPAEIKVALFDMMIQGLNQARAQALEGVSHDGQR